MRIPIFAATFNIGHSYLLEHYIVPDMFPYSELIQAVRSVEPDPFLKVSSGAIVEWADSLNISDWYQDGGALGWIKWSCPRELCLNIPWQGNSDLAGIGMS